MWSITLHVKLEWKSTNKKHKCAKTLEFCKVDLMATVHQVTSYKTFQRQHHCFVVCGWGTSQTPTGRPQPDGDVPSGSHVWNPVSPPMHEAWDSSGWKQMKQKSVRRPMRHTLPNVFPSPRNGPKWKMGIHFLTFKSQDDPNEAVSSIGVKSECCWTTC